MTILAMLINFARKATESEKGPWVSNFEQTCFGKQGQIIGVPDLMQ
jgi:hypothetical protein